MKPYSKSKSVKDLIETRLAFMCEGETFFGGKNEKSSYVVKHEYFSHEWYEAWADGERIAECLTREQAVEWLITG